jgi:hypothetical protein
MHRTLLRKLIYKPRTDILRAKFLKELKLEKKLRVTIRFTERNIEKCY